MNGAIVLASASPRRAHLLGLLGVAFATDISAIEEDLESFSDPRARAEELALAKARAVAERHPGQIILAADTIVALRGRLLGKPEDQDMAISMLRSLRGRWHRVITGLALMSSATGQEFIASEVTRVFMRHYSDVEIAAYVASGDPMDKAAAYAVQNREFHPVERLDVCYTNVMGLPLCATRDLLLKAGVIPAGEASRLRTESCSYCSQVR